MKQYSVNEEIVAKISNHLCELGNLEFDISGNHFLAQKGTDYSINNQEGNLRESNYFGRNLEYTLLVNGMKIPIVIQLYENIKKQYRIFLFGKGNKMLTSVNLTKGLDGEKIIFDIQIKISSPQNLSCEERSNIRDDIVKELRNNGLRADKKNHIEFGQYDIPSDQFINTNAEKLIKDLMIIGICKNREMFF